MNAFFSSKALIPLAVAIAVVTSAAGQARGQAVPPPAAANALPANVVPGSPLAEVIKMIQAGLDVATIESYINNSPSPFNLDADKIIFLKDEGTPSEVINAMMDRDKVLYAASVAPPPPPTPPLPPAPPVAAGTADTTAPPPDTTVAPPDATPQPDDVTANYFYNTLTPYGSWLNVAGYGQCWRPAAVNYDPTWRPYCNRGHWVYTDCGWYWDSDYAWGATFHYGRWFRSARLGWCWYPDNVWAPSWVTWRSGNDYCGWAPLPPFAVFNPAAGFFYRGLNVGPDCDFGLGPDVFVFVPPAHFCDRHPSSFAVQPQSVPQIFHQTTVINNFNVSSKTIVNRGIGVDRIASVTHRSIEPVQVGSLPNAGRQGWRGSGSGSQQTTQHTSVDTSNSGRNFATGNTGNTGNGQFPYANNRANLAYNDNGHGTPGSQQSAGNNQGQPQTYVYRQQQQQQQPVQTRQYNTYGVANNRVLQNGQNGWQQSGEASEQGRPAVSQNAQSGSQQGRNYNAAQAVGGAQPSGAGQLPPHQYAAQTQPRVDQPPTYVDSGGRNNGQPSPGQAVQQNQTQQRYAGNGGNNGGNGGNKGSGSGSNSGNNQGSGKPNQ